MTIRWHKFVDEVRDLLDGSIITRIIFGLMLLAMMCMLYFPIRCLVYAPTTIDCIVIAAIVGTILICVLLVVIAACCTKPLPPTPPNILPTQPVVMPPVPSSARAPVLPAIQENQEHFVANNPLHSTEHAPASPPRSSGESRIAASPRSSRVSHTSTKPRETDVESQSA
jgi:hypothetical protein